MSALRLTITKALNKRIWIISFYAGFEYLLNEKDIIKIKTPAKKKTENKEGSIGRLYLNISTRIMQYRPLFSIGKSHIKNANHSTGSATFSVLLTLMQGKMTEAL